jgi:two-component system OmpR family sensor kinase
MQELFYRLESLINEFASIEELLTTQKFLEKKRYKLSDLLENSIDLLLCDATLIQTQIKDTKIEVNFKFFSIALKNLLDNGLKHSSDKRVILSNSQTKILIENRGEALLKPLESYFEPFSQTQNNTTGSFGLGLYIVKHILDAHGFRLEYAYDEGVNKFFICLE